MAILESLLILLGLAILLLQVSRRLRIPYPTMLAAAGIAVAALPGAPSIALDPKLMLALFIAPALLDAGYDLPPREVARYWRPLVALAVVAVLLTTAAVAWLGWAWAGLPLAAAVALGAIVAPPDAAAASAVLGTFTLPRRTMAVLRGESLLNDATALLIYAAAVALATRDEAGVGLGVELAIAGPGGLLLGFVCGRLYLLVLPLISGTLGGTLFQFVATLGIWLIADRLHLSAVLCVVAYAMTLARYIPDQVTARERIHSYSVWEAVVFLTNVLAFLLMGLQARAIVMRLDRAELLRDFGIAAAVLATITVVRLAWVMLFNLAVHRWPLLHGDYETPTPQQGLVVGWAGMRGLITLVAALALPDRFPARDLIVVVAFTVVIGTLVIQGLTLGPLIRWLKIAPDHSFDRELSGARVEVMDAALATLEGRPGGDADEVRRDLNATRDVAADKRDPLRASGADRLRLVAIRAGRDRLSALRRVGDIDDDVFHVLEEELDWRELAALPPAATEIEAG